MSNKKIIIYYCLEFLISILLFITIFLGIFKLTLFSRNYIEKKLEKNNYYEKVEKSIIDEQSNYIMQSGLPDIVLNNIVDKNDLHNDINNMLDALYYQKDITYHTENLEDRLMNNINEYLKDKKNVEFDGNSLDNFVKTISNVYKVEIVSVIPVKFLGNVISKINVILSILLSLLVVILITLLILTKKIFKKEVILIPIMTTSFLLLFVKMFITNNIDINNILILSKHFSNLLQSVINSVLNYTLTVAIVFYIISLMLCIKSKIKAIKAKNS